MTRPIRSLALVAVLLLGAVSAQGEAGSGLVDPSQMPGPLKEVRYDQNLGALLPLDATFRDEHGTAVRLGDIVRDKPVILAFVYYECPMLCSLILNAVTKMLGVVDLAAGEDYDVVIISFDPGETPQLAAATKAELLERYDRTAEAAGWHFLTGEEAAITRVTETVGFQFVYDPETDEYAHTSGIVIARPDGTINQYYYGLEYPARDVKLALVDASAGKIGSVVDQILLYCFRYDPSLGKYTLVAMRALRLAGGVFALGLATFLWLMWRRERSQLDPAHPIADHPQPPPVGAA